MADKWTIKNFHHKYVELWVRALERVPYLDRTYIKVPKLYAKVWNYPDSTWKYAGKNLAYHVAHLAAVASAAGPLVLLVL